VTTSFEYRLHPVGPTVFAGPVFYPGHMAGDILRFYREWTKDAPDELTTLVSLATAPPAPFLPEAAHGQRGVVVAGMYAGSVEDGQRAMQPLRELGEPVADLMGPMPYAAMQSILDPLWGPGAYNYFKSGWLSGLDDDSIETIVRYHANISSPKSEIHIHQLGGAFASVPAGATAFGDRSAPFLLNIIASTFTEDGYDEAVGWAQEFHGQLEPGLTGGTYVNFLSNEGEGRVQAAYGAEKFARLQAIKDEYDPTNLFRLNQNIPPSRG
jgi:hypothetical protein